MRVFKTIYHDLKQRIPFKETLPYLKERMASVPFPYVRMSIDFQDFSLESNRAEKLLKQFPRMEKYRAGRGFYASGVVPEDEGMIRDIAALVPRPVFFEEMKIALEDVDWFAGAANPPVQLYPGCDVSNQAIGPWPRLSNRVEISKGYDYGTKYNPVAAVIEITQSMQECMNTAPILEKLTEWFGKPRNSHMLVKFSSEEQKINLEKAGEIMPWIDAVAESTKQALAQALPPLPEFSVFDMQEGLRPLAGLEVKPPLQRLSKAHDYRYVGYASYRFVCRQVNEANHCFEIVAFVEKSKYLSLTLEARGFNFEFSKPLGKVLNTSQEVMEAGLALCLTQGTELARHIAPILLETFRPSPDWMTY